MKKYIALLGLFVIFFAGCGGDSGGGEVIPPTTVQVPSVSESVTNTEETVITNSAGVKIYIPKGAVPLSEQGAAQPMVFSIEESTEESNATNPSGYTKVGKHWLIGPENFTFAKSIALTFPINEALINNTIYRLGRLNQETGKWDFISSEIKASYTQGVQAPTFRSQDINSNALHAAVMRGGRYGILSTPQDPKSAGAVKIENTFSDRYISVCVVSYQLKYPEQDANWNSTFSIPLAPPGHFEIPNETHVTLPQGRYVLAITKHNPISQIDAASGLPDGWIKTAVLDVNKPGQIPASQSSSLRIEYDPSASLRINRESFNDPSFTDNPSEPSCVPTPSKLYGQGGDVGVTLTWGKKVDLDLYVTDPNGVTVFYGDKTPANTKGVLDVDRKCSNIDEGSLVENIFWPAEQAPGGEYKVKVEFYSNCGETSTPISFNVKTVINGVTKTYSKSVTNVDDEVDVTTFRFDYNALSLDPALVGDWTISGYQENVDNSQWNGNMTLKSDGELNLTWTQGLFTCTRNGSWSSEGGLLKLEHPTGNCNDVDVGIVHWKGPVQEKKVTNGIYETPESGPQPFGWGGYWSGSKN